MKKLNFFKRIKQKIQNRFFVKENEIEDPKSFGLDGKGWLHITGARGTDRSVDLVKGFDRIPGLKYFHYNAGGGGYYTYEYVIVRDDIGRLVDLYMSLDEPYANLSLDDFILKALTETFNARSGDDHA